MVRCRSDSAATEVSASELFLELGAGVLGDGAHRALVLHCIARGGAIQRSVRRRGVLDLFACVDGEAVGSTND